jgi:hypothetical protein
VRAGERCLDQPLHEALRRLAEIDGSGLGQGLQARGEVHRVAERGHRCAFAANLGADCETRIDADPHLGTNPMFGFDRRGGGGEPFVNPQARAAGSQRRVLQRLRHAEQRHDAVAGEILDRAALLLHRTGHQFVDRLDQRERAFLAQPLGNRGEADHVREKRCHLPPLARGRGGSGGSRGSVAHPSGPQVPIAGEPKPSALCGLSLMSG